jgi:uncharacterized membrane protein HdeD (DUF308 family)
MIRFLDRAAAVLVSLVGVVHLAVGGGVFVTPTEAGVWFLSAGLLLIVSGLANLTAPFANSRGAHGPALVGCVSILLLGGLLVRADPGLLFAPQTIVLIALGGFLAVRRARAILMRPRQP